MPKIIDEINQIIEVIKSDYSTCSFKEDYDYGDITRIVVKHLKKVTQDGGAFSTVIIPNNKTWCIKLVDKEYSSYYLKYIKHCIKHPHKNLPKIHKIWKLSPVNNTCLVFMEKLYPLPHNTYNKVMEDIFENNDENISKFNYHPCAKILYRMIKHYNVDLDLHGNNFMKRKNGSWVLTDPVVG